MDMADFSKKILKILAEKPLVAVSDISARVSTQKADKKAVYATTRSLKALTDGGFVEAVSSIGDQQYARLTPAGKQKAHSATIEQDTALVSHNWDGKWRIVLLDMPESRKNERESLRYLLKKANFVCLKNSAWVSPFPYEHLFTNIKKDLGLTTELTIIVTDTIDEVSHQELLNVFGGK